MMPRNGFIRATSVTLAGAALFLLAAPMQANAVGTNLLLNPGFEEPAQTPSEFGTMVLDGAFTGWQTTDVEGVFEVWSHLDASDFDAGEGQYIELNAYSSGAVYQDIATTPCDVLTWTVDHRARLVGTDTMHVLAGAAGGTGAEGLVMTEATTRDGLPVTATTSIADDMAVEPNDETWDDAANWHTWTGTYQVPAGQTSTRVAFKASDLMDDVTIGNFLDNVVVTAEAGTCPVTPPPAPEAPQLAMTGGDLTAIASAGVLALLLAAVGFVLRRRRSEA